MNETTTAGPREGGAVDVVGYCLAVLFPLIGFIVGLVRLNKSRHGIWIVVTSLAVFVAWLLLVANSGGNGGRYG